MILHSDLEPEVKTAHLKRGVRLRDRTEGVETRTEGEADKGKDKDKTDRE